MKVVFCFLFLISTAFAQDPSAYFKNFDNKVYSLKSKGVKEFVVDIRSPKLTKQLNDQQIFGIVKDVIFRTYWTADPERLAIEVIGLPEGFKEVKEELKASILNVMDNLIPLPMAQRFNGYKFTAGSSAKTFVAQDSAGVAPIQSYVIKFDDQDRLTEVVGQKPIGTLVIAPVYTKESFADGKWVLTKQTTTTTDHGQVMILKKVLSYGQSQGIGVLKEIETTTEQKSSENAKANTTEESVTFSDYKINQGVGLKYFLGENSKEAK